MFRILLGFSFALSTASKFNRPTYQPLFVLAKICCKRDLGPSPHVSDRALLSECFQVDRTPSLCELETCIAIKRGYAYPDGTINKNALQYQLEREFASNTDALNAILNKCLYGDVFQYGRDGFCTLMRMNKCIEIQMLKSCNGWKDDEECEEFKIIAESIIQEYP